MVLARRCWLPTVAALLEGTRFCIVRAVEGGWRVSKREWVVVVLSKRVERGLEGRMAGEERGEGMLLLLAVGEVWRCVSGERPGDMPLEAAVLVADVRETGGVPGCWAVDLFGGMVVDVV